MYRLINDLKSEILLIIETGGSKQKQCNFILSFAIKNNNKKKRLCKHIHKRLSSACAINCK